MVESHLIPAGHETTFEHAYPSEAPDLRRLYENAKRDQWNVSKDVEWTQPFDIEQGVLADEMIDIYGTPFWDRLTPAQRSELNRRRRASRRSTRACARSRCSSAGRSAGAPCRAGRWSS